MKILIHGQNGGVMNKPRGKKMNSSHLSRRGVICLACTACLIAVSLTILGWFCNVPTWIITFFCILMGGWLGWNWNYIYPKFSEEKKSEGS
jgi:hypothetical protein